jgi:hypothetical protein
LETAPATPPSAYDEFGVDDAEIEPAGPNTFEDPGGGTTFPEAEKAIGDALIPSPFEIAENVICEPPHVSPSIWAQSPTQIGLSHRLFLGRGFTIRCFLDVLGHLMFLERRDEKIEDGSNGHRWVTKEAMIFPAAISSMQSGNSYRLLNAKEQEETT